MNKIHILTINDRKEVFEITKNFWESHGWEVIPEYNDNTKPAVGRNRILKKFYESDEDWIAMSDDDIILVDEKEFKEHGSIKALVGEVDYPKLNYRNFLTNNEKLFNNEDLPITFSFGRSVNLAGRWNMVSLAKQYNESDLFNNNWVFERFPKTAAIVFHQNTKKKYNKEFFYNESLEGLEDWVWAMDQIEAGYTPAQLTNICYSECSTKSVLYTGKTNKESIENRRIAFLSAKEYIVENFDGVSIMKNSGINMRKWLKRTWKPQRGWTGERIPRLFVEGEKNEL